MKIFCCFAALSVAFSGVVPVSAQYIVDTGNPQMSNGGSTLAPTQMLAGQFTVNGNATIQSIEGWIGSSTRSPGTISLHRDNGLPGAALFSKGYLINTTYSTDEWQGVFNLGWIVNAGTYWVSFSNSGSGYMAGQAPNPLARYAFANTGSNFAWRQSGSDFGVRIGGFVDLPPPPPPPPPAVPEPEVWGMIILGFSLSGFVMRGRRQGRLIARTHM